MAMAPAAAPTATPTTTTPATKGGWCVPKAGLSDAELQANLNYACGHGIDCGPIQQGGSCFQPDTLEAHAAYAMNLYYQTSGRDPKSCDFSQTATLSPNTPSMLYFYIFRENIIFSP